MERKFNAVGYSVRNGELKLRFTTNKYRSRVLEHNGHTNVQLFALPKEMSKAEAAQWLMRKQTTPNDVKQLAKALVNASYMTKGNQPQQVEETVEETVSN